MKSKKIQLFFLAIILVTGNSAALAQDDAATTAKIQKLLRARYKDVPQDSRKFLYNAIDLNDDGKNEYLVGLTGNYFCGRAGCNMLVLNKTFSIITSLTIVQYPVCIGPPGGKEVTKGYSNLYLSTGGMGLVMLKWNGKTYYPTNPSLAPAAPKGITDGKFKFLNEQSQIIYDF